uniref:Uncharacterized protein n=1 Tax=Panagrolaimus superbus TaxID=310955 RepID=A0A914YBB8_9BILA
MKSLASVECESMINCESGKEYFSKSKYSHPIYGPNRTCEACMKFICTSDNGKTVNNGYGCYEDFETACNFLDSDIKEKIKINIKDSFYYDKNYVVFSCSDSDNCQLSIDSLLPYFKVNYLSEYVLKIDKNSDKKCDKKTTTTTTTFSPEIEISSSTAPNKNNDKTDQTEASEVFSPTLPSKAASQFDFFKLLKITVFGLIFINFW